jgi:hypothetical protein
MKLNGSFKLAGAAGIEPANGGIKSRCLTAWRRPSKPVIWPLRAAYIVVILLRNSLIDALHPAMGVCRNSALNIHKF